MDITPELFAKILDFLEFPDIVRIIKSFQYGEYQILPFISRVHTKLETINPYNLTKCCRTVKLNMNQSNYLNNSMLMMLPFLEQLTVLAGSKMTSEVFEYLPHLKMLQILGEKKETILNINSIRWIPNLEFLHISEPYLIDEHFSFMPKLKIVILENSIVTPRILNMLPDLEICMINGCLYKFESSVRNLKILQRMNRAIKVNIVAI